MTARRVLTGVVLHTRRRVGARACAVAAIALTIGTFSVVQLLQPAIATAAPANTLNFQARLETAAGAIVADGNYNVQFKLYSVSSGGTALWTESYLVSDSTAIRTANGYVTANLGSKTAFPASINWGQQLYLTMNIGGTGSATAYDGEMTPRLPLTSVPSAFALNSFNAANSFTGSLTVAQPTGGSQTFVVPDQGAAGSYTLLTTNTANTSFIQNQNASAQATSNFFISGTGRATSLQASSFDTPTAIGLNIGTTTATSVTVGRSGITTTNAGALTSNGLLTAAGGLTVATGSTFTNASSTVLTAIPLSLGATGNIGANTATVDVASNFNVTATAAGLSFTLPTPTASTTAGRIVYVSNVGATNTFTMYGAAMAPGTTQSFVYNGSAWTTNGSGPSGNYIQNSSAVQAGANFNIGGNGTIGGNLSVTGTINTNTLSSTVLSFSGANPVISPSTTNSGLTVNANGTGTLSLDTTGGGTVTVGTNAATVNIGGGTNAETINIGNSSGNDTVNIATGAGTDAVNIGTTSGSATTIVQGSTNTGTSVRMQGGSNYLYVGNNGVGIGTTAPGAMLGVSGTFNAGGLATFNGGVTIATGSQFTNNSATVFGAINITSSNTSFGSAATTVDVATTLAVTQNSNGQNMVLPNPTTNSIGRVIYVTNVGTKTFQVSGTTLASHSTTQFLWDGTQWTSAAVFGATNSYINNDTTQQDFASFNIDGSGQIGTTLTVAGLTTLSGGLTGVGTFNINTTGTNTTTIGNSGSATTINGPLTVTGAANINTGGTAATTIGNNGAALTINSSGLKVTSAGAVSGVTTIVASAGLTAVGVNSGSGQIQGTGGLNVSGTVQFGGLNTAGIVTNTAAGVLGTVASIPVANGGTGLTSAAQYGILYGNGTAAMGVVNPGTAGYCLSTNSTASAPTWKACSDGVTTVGTFSTATNANGIGISGNTITLYAASATSPGGVSAAAQSFGGDKTFANNLIVTGTTTTNGALNANGVVTINNSATLNAAAGKQLAVTATAIVTNDLVAISNTAAFASTADGINGQQITWFGKPSGSNQSSAQRIQVTNSNTATGGQVQGMRIIATGAGGAVNSDTVGIKIDNLTSPSSGTANENAIEVGTGWDNVIQSANFTVSQAGAVTAASYSGIGTNLTALSATNINQGTLADARLSSNVALYNAATANFTGLLQNQGSKVCTEAGNCTTASTVLLNADKLYKYDGNSAGVAAILGTNDNFSLSFETNNVTRATIDTAGNLGIAGTGNVNIGGGTLQTAGTTRLTNNGTLQNVTYNGNTIGTAYGGTGLTGYTANGIFYATNSTTMGQLTGTAGQVLLANASGVPTFTTLSGDVTVSNAGVTAISSGVIVNADLAGGSYTGITTVGTLTTLAVNGATTLTGATNINTTGTAGTTIGNTNSATTINGPLTTTGTANINTTGTALTTIGNAGSGLVINSTGLKVTQAGVASGLTGLSSSGSVAFSGLSTAGIVTNTAAGVLGTTNLLDETLGGTGQSSYAVGDILYASASNVLSKRTIGTAGQCLVVTAGLPTWASCNTGAVTTVGTYSTTATNANGATISGNTISFQSASASAPGMVDTGTQTFAGAKTFNGALSAASTLNVTGLATFNGGITANLGAGQSQQLIATATPTLDLSTISNSSAFAPTGDGINGQQINWFTRPSGTNMSSAQRINLDNVNTAAGGQVQAIRIIADGAGGTINSDTVGILIDNLANSSTGTAGENALEIGSGWDNVIKAANFNVTQGGALTSVGINSGSGLIQGTGGMTVAGTVNINTSGAGTTNIGTTASANTVVIGSTNTALTIASSGLKVNSAGVASGLTGLSSSGTITFSGLTTNGVVTVSGGTLSSSASLGAANGGTGLTVTPSNGQLAIGNGSGYSLNTLTPGNNIAITNGSGSITVATTQNPTFTTSVTTPLITSSSALTLQSASGQSLNLNTGTAGGVVTTNAGTIQRTAAGTTNIDLSSTGTTTLELENSGSGVANLNLFGGSLQTGSTAVTRLTNAGALTNITGYTQTSGSAIFNQNAADQLRVVASAVPTTDMVVITNTGRPITTNGINGQQIDYYAALNNAASESGALRVNITNTSATAGSTADGIRVVASTNGTSNTNGIKIDNITGSGTGIETAINVGTGWDSILSYNGTSLINNLGVLQTAALAGTYGNALTFSNAGNNFTGVGTGLTALNGTNISTGTVADARLSTNIARYNATTANFTGTLQNGGNEVCNFSGNCSDVNTTTLNADRYFKYGGNSGGIAALLGTNDNFALSLRTNNVNRVTIDTVGNLNLLTGGLQVNGTTVLTTGRVLQNVTYNGGTIGVAYGGTGATTLTTNGVLYGNGTGAIGAVTAGTTGQCLVATTGSAPTWGTCAGSGSGSTLQAAYNNSVGGTTPEIVLDSTRTTLDVQAYNGQTADLINLRAYAASGLGASRFSVSVAGVVTSAAGLNVLSGGADIIGGIDNNAGGISNVGAITNATSITSTGGYTQSGTSQNTLTGLLQSSGGITANGAINLNTTGTGATNIGTTTGANAVTIGTSNTTLAIASSGFNAATNGTLTAGTYNGQTISSTASLTGTLAVATLGSNGSTVICRNASNQLATCAGTGSPFVQGGNSFGAEAVLGTNDNNNLVFETNGTTALTLDTSNNATFAGTVNVANIIQGSGKNAIQTSDTYLRLNNSNQFTNGVYTPGAIRLDGNLSVYSGNLTTGTASTIRLTNAGALTNITGYTQASGSTIFNQNAADQLKVAASAVPTTDMVVITNTGRPVTTSGINGQQIDYYAALNNAASESGALRVNITNTSNTVGATADGIRIVATTNVASNTNGLKIDSITGGSGIDTAVNIGTGWNSLLSYNGTSLISGTGVLQTAALSGTYGNALSFTNTGNSYFGSGANLTALNANNISSGTLAVARGGTGLGTTPTNGQLLIGNGSGYALATIASGSNVSITNGSGTISVATIQNPTFTTSVTTPNITSTGTTLAVNTSAAGGTITTNAATIQRTAAGTTILDLNDTGTTIFRLQNSGSGVSNFNLFGGSLTTGSTNTVRLDNSGNLLNIGTFTGSGAVTVSNTLQGTRLISTVANGTAPLTVTSQTLVNNLNADLLDGLDSSAFALANGSTGTYIQNGTSPQTANFNITGAATVGSLTVNGDSTITGNATVQGEIIGVNAGTTGQIRLVQGSYGSIWRQDGTNLYLLTTASGSPYGTYNALRPLTVNNATGDVQLGGNKLVVDYNVGVSVNGTLNVSGVTSLASTLTVGSNLAYSGGIFGNGKLAIQTTDTFLRLNQGNDFTSGVYTPGALRADGALTVNANTDLNGHLSVTQNTGSYVAEFINQASGNGASGLLVQINRGTATRVASNRFIDFGGSNGIAGKIQGASNAVAYVTNGADYAEYFLADPTDLPVSGELVTLDATRPNGVRRASANDPITGIISTAPGFIGNGPVCQRDDNDCDANYAKTNVLVSLTGQVPMKTNAEGGAIMVGDPIGASSVPGVATRALGRNIVGYALTTPDASGMIQVVINVSNFDGSKDLQAAGVTAQSLNLTGSAAIAGNLNVSGHTTLTSLTVKGSVGIEGGLTVTGPVNVGTITVNGHIITAGNTPTIALGSAAGQNGIVTVDGTDSAGTLGVKVAAKRDQNGNLEALNNGVLAEITFSQQYESTPRIVVSPMNEASVGMPVYVVKTANGYKLMTKQAAVDGSEYQFDYVIIGSRGQAAAL